MALPQNSIPNANVKRICKYILFIIPIFQFFFNFFKYRFDNNDQQQVNHSGVCVAFTFLCMTLSSSTPPKSKHRSRRRNSRLQQVRRHPTTSPEDCTAYWSVCMVGQPVLLRGGRVTRLCCVSYRQRHTECGFPFWMIIERERWVFELNLLDRGTPIIHIKSIYCTLRFMLQSKVGQFNANCFIQSQLSYYNVKKPRSNHELPPHHRKQH